MRPTSFPPFSLAVERANALSAGDMTGVPKGVTQRWRRIANVRCLYVRPAIRRHAAAIVFLHGGAFCLMSAKTHARMAGHIANAAGCDVILPDYALAPEHPFPAALNECRDVVAALLERGHRPLALMGDSAGGGLALSVLLALRAAGSPLPGCAVLMSPWLDMTLSGASVAEAATRDVILVEPNLHEMARLYVGGANPTDPLLSPLNADLGGLPPIYVQASEYDLLRDDSLRLRDRNPEIRVELWPEMLHSFPFFAGIVPEADAAIESASAFIIDRLQPEVI